MCVCVCVCVKERERKNRERHRERRRERKDGRKGENSERKVTFLLIKAKRFKNGLIGAK